MATTTAPKQRSETAEQVLDLAETLIQTLVSHQQPDHRPATPPKANRSELTYAFGVTADIVGLAAESPL